MMRDVLLVVPDLMFNVRIADAVRALGGTPRDVTAATVLQHVQDADLVVVETGAQSPWAAVVAQLKQDPTGQNVPVLAYGPHVDVTAQRAAVAAGCDRIVTRGKLAAELIPLLTATARHLTAPSPPDPDTGTAVPEDGV